MFRNPAADTIVVLLIVLLFFGPKRLPALARSLGEGIREFRGTLPQGSEEDENATMREARSSEPGATAAGTSPDRSVADA